MLNSAIRRLKRTHRKLAYTTNASNNWSGVALEERRLSNPASVQVEKLSNGLQIVAFPDVRAIASVSLHIHAGTRCENSKTIGVTQFLKHFAFKDNLVKYGLQVIRDLEKQGAELTSIVNRESLTYHIDAVNNSGLRKTVGETLRSILLGEYRDWVLRDVKKSLRREATELLSNPVSTVFEGLHREAYRNQGLGSPLNIPFYAIDGITHETLGNHVTSFFTPSNMTLVGTGIDTGDLNKIAEQLFLSSRDAPNVTHPTQYKTNYVGGQSILPGNSDTHLVVTFGGPPLSAFNDHVASIVLQAVLGAGSNNTLEAFPGTGVAGKLARNLINKNDWIKRATAINIPYYDAGLFGVYAQAEEGHAQDLVAGVRSVLQDVAAGSFSPEELNRAKAVARAEFVRQMECRETLNEFLSRHAVLGNPITPAQYIDAINQVNNDNLSKVAEKIFSFNPTVSITGDVWGFNKF
eukprot:TRINITY_DN6520_c0_g1_i1.p1 TRINITY_DN6520_c0_g1~~TRINITY_DN6520_c0_g1_i1.p1  ORF type:complete len:464 (-),score=83.94 TRINITY_DN6520_c0_g1_i1:54-1445(-)